MNNELKIKIHLQNAELAAVKTEKLELLEKSNMYKKLAVSRRAELKQIKEGSVGNPKMPVDSSASSVKTP